GQRAAVYRYNHSQAYVDLVLKIMNAYLEGDFTSVPNNSTAAGYVVPEPPSFDVRGPGSIKTGGAKGNSTGTTTGSSDVPPPPPVEADNGSGGSNTGGDKGGNDGGTKTPSVPAVPAVPEIVDGIDSGVGEVTSNLISGVLGLLTKQEAADACQAKYPKLTQSLDLLNCLLSYGLSK
ncbi:MAG TPA: hypothetical protein VGE43_04285, partial [Acidimicrobiales bacterium]